MSVVTKAIKAMATFVIVAGALAAVAVGANVVHTDAAAPVTLTPPKLTPSGPIISVTGLREGESRSSEFEITNNNLMAARIFFSGTLTGGNSELYDALTASLQSATTGAPIWSGRLRDLDVGRIAGSIGAGTRRRYLLTVGVPSWAGNNLQNRRSEFNLHFAFTLDAAGGDTVAPMTSISLANSTRVRTRHVYYRPIRLTFTGRAWDNASDIARVEVSLVRYTRPVKLKRGKVQAKQRVCRRWIPTRRKFVGRTRGRCVRMWITAAGTDKWRYRFARQRLKPGRYELRVRAVDAAGNADATSRRTGPNTNVIRFWVKRHSKRK